MLATCVYTLYYKEYDIISKVLLHTSNMKLFVISYITLETGVLI